MATEKAPEKAPETSSTSKSDAEIFQLEALSLNYLRSQNVSAIPDDDYIPKLHPCKLCNKAILSFRFEAFTALTCGHLFHRICLEIHIIRGATKYPACPTCKTDIEIFREETALASGECDVIPRRYDKGKASQQSNVTIDDDMEFMQELGLIAEKGSSSVSVEITKQVNEEGRGSSPTSRENISDTQNSGASTTEKGTTNVVQVNSTSSSRHSSPRIEREQDKLQGLMKELLTPTRDEDEKENDSEESGGTMAQILARLYRKASLAEKRVVKANQDEIISWYRFAESFEKRVKEIMDGDMRLNDQQARTRVYEEVVEHLPGFTKDSLRKRTVSINYLDEPITQQQAKRLMG